MKPAPFDYIRVRDMDHAAIELARGGRDARILAGGQSLIAMLNMRLAEPRLIIDISRMDCGERIALRDGVLQIAAPVTQSEVLRFPDLATQVPLLAMALPHVGHVQTRNKGTVCGSIAHADPSSELPLVLAVLGGTVHLNYNQIRDHVDGHAVSGDDFFVGPLETKREPNQFLGAVRFPLALPGEGYAFEEMSLRHGDFAIVAVAVKTTASAIRIGVGGAADKPHVRTWPVLDGSALDDALNALAWELEFQEDVHANATYRRHLVRTLGRRTILEALGRRAHV